MFTEWLAFTYHYENGTLWSDSQVCRFLNVDWLNIQNMIPCHTFFRSRFVSFLTFDNSKLNTIIVTIWYATTLSSVPRSVRFVTSKIYVYIWQFESEYHHMIYSNPKIPHYLTLFCSQVCSFYNTCYFLHVRVRNWVPSLHDLQHFEVRYTTTWHGTLPHFLPFPALSLY